MDEGCDNEIILMMKMSMAEQSRAEQSRAEQSRARHDRTGQGSLGGYDFGNRGLETRCLATATDKTTDECASEHGERLHAETPGAGSTIGKCRPQAERMRGNGAEWWCWGSVEEKRGV